MDGVVRVELSGRWGVGAVQSITATDARLVSRARRIDHCSRTFATLSHCDMSDTMTLSFGCRPPTISIVLTELRPSFTFTRLAVLPSGSSLNNPTVLS